ncbi:MAG: winged helix-turn-helix transcriptional regulator [Alphaproteobacteria bacterium]|nr:winged helix-turn-helix transcriptional regulator [Alphaproteobacteria bacterium]
MNKDSEENVLKILANPIRENIVRSLHKDKLSFTHLMQITNCKTGQLSFHLNKLGNLIEQDELKRYSLSDRGREVGETILPRLEKGELAASEKEIEVGFALKQFVESFVYFISSCIYAVKYVLIHTWKYLVSGSRFFYVRAPGFLQRHAVGNIKSFNGMLKQMYTVIVNSLKQIVISAMKYFRYSINPLISYSFMIIGLMLFIPALFVSVSPGFDHLLSSVAEDGKPVLSEDGIDLANQLYEDEMLPNQAHYQNNYSSESYQSMNYINMLGYPLTAKKVKTWQREVVKGRIQFVKDMVFAVLSSSFVMILIGSILAFAKKMVQKRLLLSTIFSSMLLTIASAFLLISMNSTFMTIRLSENAISGYAIFGSASALVRNLIIVLLLIVISSSSLHIHSKIKRNDFY